MLMVSQKVTKKAHFYKDQKKRFCVQCGGGILKSLEGKGERKGNRGEYCLFCPSCPDKDYLTSYL